MSRVQIDGLGKTYANGVAAVKNISIDIADGELVVVVGPSGCGKSTLLRMIAGLESITSGDLWIKDQRVNDREPAYRDIAMVFQNYALYPHMTVFDNMAYGLKNRKLAKAEIDKRVKEAAKTLELSQLLDRKPGQLSGGQRQRVAMGRAIVRKPEVFLFDEPLSNLDARLRGQMRLEIKKLQRRLKTTAIYVTHDQIEAMTLADRLIVMNNGIPEQIGTPDELYSNPSSLFVAGFLGSPSINLLKATQLADGIALGHSKIATLSGKLDGDSAILGIRAEDLQLCSKEYADLILSVELVERLGSELLAVGVVKGSNERLSVRLDKSAQIDEGHELPLEINRDHWHWFDADTGLRNVDCYRDAISEAVI
ncbi:sn-glycerol-3-phosphate ABC transporter ATP-binding protein UgpC [Endozoicomonas acroporae]|uniref:sn-glycerol-3-phosphate ABC transporter ATP-binding protein UgpC n=1 Tax=Endozoicomonas acroporae TaxID=1701104 RepID=UPI000C7926DC|nr:sn-glycerol-3-phosphate ABC transporter ATP-binding protein UgpC [Endozoicomonas acroporae]